MVDNHSKVIPIRLGQTGNGVDSSPLIQVKKTGRAFLLKCFQSVFDVVDDTFFDLADRAENHRQQTAYFDAMRVIRLERKNIENQLLIQIDQRFSTVSNTNASLPKTNPGSKNELELVDEAHLEEIIALDTMVSRCLQNAVSLIEEFNARLSGIMPIVVTAQNNPFGPEAVCDIFGESTKKLTIDIRSKLVFYKLFERYVLNELGSFYSEANQLLEQLGVKQVKSRLGRRPKPEPKPAQQAASSPDTNAAQLSQRGGVEPLNSAQSVLVSRLNRLMRKASISGVSEPDKQGAVATLDDVIEQIADIQGGLLEAKGYLEKISLTELLENQLSHRIDQPPVNLGQDDKTVVQLVDQLLDHFDAGSDIPASIEPLMQALKLPMLSVALRDAAFFDKNQHPARRLLNEIAQLSVRFDEQEDKKNDALYLLIESLVQTLTKDSHLTTQTLTSLFADFLEKIGKHERRIAAIEKRLMEETEAREKVNQAHTQVAMALGELLEGKILPRVVVEFAELAWSKVMFLTCLKLGMESDEWQWDLDTITLLVQFSEVGKVDIEIEQQLLAVITERLQHAAVDAHLRNGFISRLKTFFNQAETSDSEDKVLVEAFRADLPGQMINDEGSTEAELDSQTLEKADILHKGDWVKLTTDDDFHKRCKLAGIISPSGKYLFVNRQGGREEALSRAKVALEIQNNKLVVLDNSDLFDRTLNTLVSDFRQRSKLK